MKIMRSVLACLALFLAGVSTSFAQSPQAAGKLNVIESLVVSKTGGNTVRPELFLIFRERKMAWAIATNWSMKESCAATASCKPESAPGSC
jgi:hypothetical protein